MSDSKIWRRKRKKKFDKEDIRINYHLRFVSATTQGDVPSDLNNHYEGDSFDCKLTGDEVRCFYENLVNSDSSIAKENQICRSGADLASSTGCENGGLVVDQNLKYDTLAGGNVQENSKDGRQVIKNVNESTIKQHVQSKSSSKKSKISKVKSDACSDIESVKKLVARILKLCCSDSNIKELEGLLDSIRDRTDYTTIVNASDQYGWTALMCAAAEGCIEIVQLLTKEGVFYQNITDKSGCSVYDICERRQQWVVCEYLLRVTKNSKNLMSNVNRQQDDRRSHATDTVELIKCQLCDVEYKSHERKHHESSTLHLFNDNTKQVPRQQYALSDTNIGFQMMLRSGWEVDSGLGPDGFGRKNPIKTVLKQDRTGLGLIENPEKRVSHFNAFDKDAVSRRKHGESSKQQQQQSLHSSSSRNDEKKKTLRKDKNWERNMRRYMSSDD